MIEYLRHKQKEFIEGNEPISGLDIAKQLLQDATIPLTMYISIYPAIENYKDPYTIIPKE